MKNLLIFLLAVILVWALLGGGANAVTPQANTGDCLADIRAQFVNQWADLSLADRLVVAGMASSCAERRQR